MSELINDANFTLYAARNYDNPQCYEDDEFQDDLKRFKYLKRLFGKYRDTGELRERLILNHIIVLYNVFGPAATKMLFFKLDEYHPCLKPFVVMLGYMPDVLLGINDENNVLRSSDIPMDSKIVETLREI
tara:strand:- start:698 stop:1087 length:390 start_codon:yes stop_codon:yes gene_type:complete